jgi:hypothetical protein
VCRWWHIRTGIAAATITVTNLAATAAAHRASAVVMIGGNRTMKTTMPNIAKSNNNRTVRLQQGLCVRVVGSGR